MVRRHFSVEVTVNGTTRWVPVTVSVPARDLTQVWTVEFDGISYSANENPSAERIARDIERYYAPNMHHPNQSES